MYNIDKITKDLQNNLSKKRYKHSLEVAKTAEKLAIIYGIDKEKAYLAGLVHDIAKEFSNEENNYYIKKYSASNDQLKTLNKKIIHAPIGALYVKEKYNLEDDICNAIKFHTTASKDMSILDKIVFIADKIEPGRNYEYVDEIRTIAYTNLDQAIELYFINIINKLNSKKH